MSICDPSEQKQPFGCTLTNPPHVTPLRPGSTFIDGFSRRIYQKIADFNSYPLRYQYWKSVNNCGVGTQWRNVWWIRQGAPKRLIAFARRGHKYIFIWQIMTCPDKQKKTCELDKTNNDMVKGHADCRVFKSFSSKVFDFEFSPLIWFCYETIFYMWSHRAKPTAWLYRNLMWKCTICKLLLWCRSHTFTVHVHLSGWFCSAAPHMHFCCVKFDDYLWVIGSFFSFFFQFERYQEIYNLSHSSATTVNW